jgi:hypothetical protein
MVDCPVPNCPGRSASRGALRQHFAYRHPKDTIIIREEGLLPRCPRCLAFVRGALSDRHRNSQRCVAGTQRQRRRILEFQRLQERGTTFTVLGDVIESVDTFRYLGCPLTVQYSDWPAVRYNMRKARSRWARVSSLLRREKASPKVSGYFYKAIIQSVLLFSSETWVLPEAMVRLLEGFHNTIARRITNRIIRPRQNGMGWIYPAAQASRTEAALRTMKEYLNRKKQYLVQWFLACPNCEETSNLEVGVGGARRSRWWTPNPLVETDQANIVALADGRTGSLRAIPEGTEA